MAVVGIVRAQQRPQPLPPIVGVDISLSAGEAALLRAFLRRVSNSREVVTDELIGNLGVSGILTSILVALDKETI